MENEDDMFDDDDDDVFEEDDDQVRAGVGVRVSSP